MDPTTDNPLQGLVSGLFDVAGAYIAQGVSVTVQTNYSPPVTVYSGSLDGSGGAGGGSGNNGAGGLFSRLVGLQVGVTVKDSTGRTLANYGGSPEMSPVRVFIALAALGGLGYLAFKAIRAV